ncbi:hypothetical protein JCM8547_008052 [Rhodosporidiobolus lusitaniae]
MAHPVVNPFAIPGEDRSRPLIATWGTTAQLVAVAERFEREVAVHLGAGEPVFDASIGLVLSAMKLRDRSCASTHDFVVDNERFPNLLGPFTQIYNLPSGQRLTSFTLIGCIFALCDLLEPIPTNPMRYDNEARKTQLVLRNLRVAMAVLMQHHKELHESSSGGRSSPHLELEQALHEEVENACEVFSGKRAWARWIRHRAEAVLEYVDDELMPHWAAAIEVADWEQGREKPDAIELAEENLVGWTAVHAFLQAVEAAAAETSYSLSKRSPFYPFARSAF